MFDRAFVSVLRLLRPYWVSLTILFGMLSVVYGSVDHANWVEKDGPALRSMAFGLVVGWMLARSRFSGLFSLLYVLLFGLIAGIQSAGSILPGPLTFFRQPFLVTLDEINLNMLTFWLRFNGWMETIQAGEPLKDTGLFIMLLAMLMWAMMAWFMWFFLRKRQALTAILPVGLGMAINVHLSHQSLGYYWMFLFFAVLLVARMAYMRQERDWDRRRVDYSDQLGWDWAISAVLVAILVAVVARGAPLVGTPEGWKAISEWVRSTNQQTSNTAERLFAGVNTPPPRPDGAESSIYTAAPNLREFGAPLPQGDQTVMWVFTSDPPPIPEQYGVNIPVPAEKGHYWRNGIFGAYTGRGWEPAAVLSEPATSQQPAEQPPAGRYYLRQQFEIVAEHSAELFSVNEPVQVEEGIALRQGTDGSRLLAGESSKYAVISAATRATGDQLAAAGQEYPETIRAQYLQLPDSLPGRVSVLAERVAGEGNPFQQVLRVQQYLRENYPYELNTPRPPEGRDVVDYFLFDQQQGFCTHYASAMTVMLRSLGIPSRVVTGYATGVYDSGRNAYRVPENAVHAWVEVYFPGIGWVEFEPTAAREVFEYPLNGTPAEVQAVPDLDPVGQGRLPQPVMIALVLLAALAVLAAPFVLLRMFSVRRAMPVQEQASSLYHQVRQALAWAGLSAAPSVTPEEFLQHQGGQVAPYALLQKALRQATALYQQSIFSAHPPEAGRVRSAVEIWRQSFGQWLALWLKNRRGEKR